MQTQMKERKLLSLIYWELRIIQTTSIHIYLFQNKNYWFDTLFIYLVLNKF